MVIDINEFLKQLISAGTVMALLGYLGKTAIEAYLSKNLEGYKNELGKEIEAYKNKLGMLAKEKEIKFSKLHQERAELIKQIYNEINLFQSFLRGYLSLARNASFNEQTKGFLARIAEFVPNVLSIYNPNKIVFSKKSCEMLDSFITKAGDIIEKIMNMDHENISNHLYVLQGLSDEAEMTIEPIKKNLEDEFRDLLGV